MQYNHVDDIPHSIKMALRPVNQSPCPSHYSIVGAIPRPGQPSHNPQVVSAQVLFASSSGVITASLQQQGMHLEIPLDVLLEFQQIAAFHAAIFADLRAASQELHDLVQHKTSVLGPATTTLHDGYTTVMRESTTLESVVQS